MGLSCNGTICRYFLRLPPGLSTKGETMQRNVASSRKQITRRTMLATAAAMAATPALGEECRIGPPPHPKGPPVWMDMDQVEIDAAYDQSFYAPLAGQIGKRRAGNRGAARARLGAPRREAYGPTAIEQLDIYRTQRPQAPIFVFIHGGSWLRGDAKNVADAAELFVNAGAHYVALDFIAIEAAGGDLRVMADQVRRGIAWVYQNAKSFDGDPDRFYIGGHSSGGHLCGVALVTDWEKDFGVSLLILDLCNMLQSGRTACAARRMRLNEID